VELENNYFKLFGLEQQFELDKKQLKKRSRELQQQYHPDRFLNATPHERLLAVQFSAHINTAVAILRNPVSRALHFMSLHGVSIEQRHMTIKDTAFLMEQMELREQFEDAQLEHDQQGLTSLYQQVLEGFKAAQEVFIDSSEPQDWIDAIAKMQFFDKLKFELKASLKH